MNTISSIKINGLTTAFSVDLEKEILLDWSRFDCCQKSYSLKMMCEDEIVFKLENRSSFSKRTFVTIPSAFRSSVRKKFVLQIKITGQNEEQYELESAFYSENLNLEGAKWITRLDNPIEKEYEYFQEKANIVLEKEFVVTNDLKKSFIDICGLGYYSLFINEARVHDTYLTNDVTNYDKIVYYDTMDISNYVHTGKNKVRVELGNGWYNPAPILLLNRYNIRKQLAIGKPCLLAQISLYIPDGSTKMINTDNTWVSGFGQYLSNNIYIGEHFTDATSPELAMTTKVHGPSGKLTPSLIPKVKRKKEIRPKMIKTTESYIIMDLEEIISGQVGFHINKEFIGEITLYYAEDMGSNHELNFSTSISGLYGISDKRNHINPEDPVIQKDKITKTRLEPLYFENTYTYHSFRYIKVEFKHVDQGISGEKNNCILEKFTSYRVHTDLQKLSTFFSSSTELNALWDASIDTRLNNIHSYFEDCSRERLGYGGDIVALLDTQMLTLDIESLLKKVFLDFAVDQTMQGGITQTAPYVGIMTHGPSNGSGSIGWQLVFPSIAHAICNKYKDAGFIENNIRYLVKHLDYLLSFDYDYIKHCCLGDWGSVDTSIQNGKIYTPDQTFCSACMYLIILRQYQKLFVSLGKFGSMYDVLLERVESVKARIMDEFYTHKGYFATGSQSSFMFGIQAGLLEREIQSLVEGNLLKKLEQDSWIFKFGIFGMSWAFEILSQLGEEQHVYQWLTREEMPSYRAMLSRGNKVLSEYFPIQISNPLHASASFNHAMFASYSSWMIRNLIGINTSEQDEHVIIQPYFPNELEFAHGAIDTLVGKVSLEWKKQCEGKYELNVSLPLGMKYSIKQNSIHNIVAQETGTNNKNRLVKIVYELNHMT
ncbi:alpha-L-rhamnosidase-related protein [Paenibacillus kribbensis]|uniref:alpha-L-rhamnosidase-related protein n=1 Tax=Paenibacillus kribbensis TaxID=172713 RepID=UPI002118BF61|nr:family 78 glycoside hydrolase catalytic domain [Paenibacillus kribbensis]